MVAISLEVHQIGQIYYSITELVRDRNFCDPALPGLDMMLQIIQRFMINFLGFGFALPQLVVTDCFCYRPFKFLCIDWL